MAAKVGLHLCWTRSRTHAASRGKPATTRGVDNGPPEARSLCHDMSSHLEGRGAPPAAVAAARRFKEMSGMPFVAMTHAEPGRMCTVEAWRNNGGGMGSGAGMTVCWGAKALAGKCAKAGGPSAFRFMAPSRARGWGA